jgi:hypothetical protein
MSRDKSLLPDMNWKRAINLFLFLGGGSGSCLVIFITVNAVDNGRHRFKRFTHCTLKQILGISKDWQLTMIMVEVVIIISIQHTNRKTVVIAVARGGGNDASRGEKRDGKDGETKEAPGGSWEAS